MICLKLPLLESNYQYFIFYSPCWIGPTKIRNEAKWSEMERNEAKWRRNEAKWIRNEAKWRQNEAKWRQNEAEWNKINHIIVKWKWIKRSKSEIKQIMVENEIEVWIPVYMSVCL